MRFMIMVKGDKDSEAGVMPEEKLIAAMAKYHEELAKAGVLLDASGLQPTSKGWRVKYSAGKPSVVDGPFAESKEEALEWTRRFPSPFGEQADGEIEVRQLFELDDFAPSEAVERFREIEAANKR